MPRLARLALQKAGAEDPAQQGPVGLFGLLQQQHEAEQGQGRYQSGGTVGPSESQGQGFVTGQQALLQGAQSAGGPIGVSLAMLGLPWIQQAASSRGIDLAKPWQTGYGGSSAATQEQGRVAAQMMGAQVASMGGSGVQLAVAALEQLGKTGIPVGGAVEYIKSADPNTVGMIVQQLSLQFPQIQSIMSRLDPSFITDFTPIAKATYFQNNGDFDEKLFQQTLQRFQRDYKSGQYGQVPAQIAAHSLSFVAENGVPPEMVPLASRNVAAAAHAFVDKGLAPNFGAAMQLAQSVDANVIRNPESAVQFAGYADNLARRGFLNREQIYQAAQYAAQNDLDPRATMSAVGMSGRVKRLLGDKAGKLPDLAATAIAGFQKSDVAAVLGAASRLNAQLRTRIAGAISKNDTTALIRLYETAKRVPGVAEAAQQNPGLGVMLAKQISEKSPALLGQLMTASFTQQANRDRSLARLLANPTELRRRLVTQDFTGLSRAAQDFMLRNGGADAAAALASKSPDYEGAPVPEGINESRVSRLGLQYPEPRSDVPAPISRGAGPTVATKSPLRTGPRPADLKRDSMDPPKTSENPGLGSLAFGDRTVVDPRTGTIEGAELPRWKPAKVPQPTRGI